MKVFLGGTVNGSTWRNRVKEELAIEYFDPVVDVWNDAAYERELSERRNSEFVLFVLTPKMMGYYAVAEVADDSFQRPDKTLYCYLPEDGKDFFTKDQIEQFDYLGEVVTANGGKWLKDLDEVIHFLNQTVQSDEKKEIDHYDAFISYGKGQSKEFANKLSNRLAELSYSVFYDVSDIPLIIDNEELIYRNILKSDNFIYMISPNAVHSEYCKKELEFAIRYKKRIIPVLHIELRPETDMLDEIIAKKKIVSFGESDEELVRLADDLKVVMEQDKGYVRQHSLLLFKAQRWDSSGRQQRNLLFGAERKAATNWIESTSDIILPLKIHHDYVNASKKLSWLMLVLLWLNARTKSLTGLNWFGKLTLFIGLVSPAAMAFQLAELMGKEKGEVQGVSLATWVLFLLVQISVLFEGIKNRDISAFLRMLFSMIITTGIIITLLILT